MPFPPKKPLKIDNEVLSYFEYIEKKVSPIIKERTGCPLELTGYEKLIEEFEKNNLNDKIKLYNMAIQSATWIDYLTSIKAVIYEELQNLETEKIATIATASLKADPTKVANGDRLANISPQVIAVRKTRNTVEAAYKLIQDKVDLLEKIYYLCKSACEWVK